MLYNTLLFDFYSNLLTVKQKDVFEMYYLNDYSLNEISSYYNVTPQAVSDLIKRTEKSLNNYEKKLGLIQNFNENQCKVNILQNYIKKLDISFQDKENILNLIKNYNI